MTPGVVGFVDRRTRLLVIGILILVAGIMCLLMAGFMPIMLFLPKPAGMGTAHGPQPIDIVPGMLLYVALAALAIGLAVGMMRVRKWVRPVILCACTIWILVGIGATVLFCVMIPHVLKTMRNAAGPGMPVIPNGVAIAIMVGTGTFMVVLYLIVPVLLMLAVQSRDVQATLEFFDPHPRWTDGVPLTVLGLSMGCLLGAIGTLFSMPRGLFLLFGVALFGWPGRIALLVVFAILIVTAILVFRRKLLGWWLLVITSTLLPTSWIITLFRVDLGDVYDQMGMDTSQLKMMNVTSGSWVGTIAAQTAALTVVMLYVAWKARKHFVD